MTSGEYAASTLAVLKVIVALPSAVVLVFDAISRRRAMNFPSSDSNTSPPDEEDGPIVVVVVNLFCYSAWIPYLTDSL